MKSFEPVFTKDSVRLRPGSCALLDSAAKCGSVQLKALGHGAYPGVHLPDNVLPELRSAGYWNAAKHQTWGLDWHYNEGIEFTYLFKGNLDFAADEKSGELYSGHFTITRPWQLHRVGSPNVRASRLGWIIIDVGVRRPNQEWNWPKWVFLTDEERERLSSLLRLNDQLSWKADTAIARAFHNISRTTERSEKRFDRTGMVLAINELLLATLNLLESKKIPLDDSLTSSQRTVELFLARLRDRCGETWTLERMAEECGLRRSQFAGYCTELKNQSPLQFLNECRIDMACRLLTADPGMAILDIAIECGFSSSQMFATVFRRIKAQSPRDYREAALGSSSKTPVGMQGGAGFDFAKSRE